ncbi:hypothetical protein JW721_05480 [Candidatus Micrarchaeota archaeon]|nr:hypothetical protein [Candidatus Micrarchaeota archaeon]
MIEEYSFGRIVISGKEYSNDVILIGGKVYPEWWRRKGHFLSREDLGPILKAQIRTLIIGKGYNSVMRIGEDVREYCREKGIELIELGSREAVEKVNELMWGKRHATKDDADSAKPAKGIAAGIHLTC